MESVKGIQLPKNDYSQLTFPQWSSGNPYHMVDSVRYTDDVGSAVICRLATHVFVEGIGYDKINPK